MLLLLLLLHTLNFMAFIYQVAINRLVDSVWHNWHLHVWRTCRTIVVSAACSSMFSSLMQLALYSPGESLLEGLVEIAQQQHAQSLNSRTVRPLGLQCAIAEVV